MTTRKQLALVLVGVVAGSVMLAGQAPTTKPATQAAAKKPRVFFVEPQDKATVTSPLHMKFGSEGFQVGAVPPGDPYIPLRIGRRPVSSAARLGEQTGWT